MPTPRSPRPRPVDPRLLQHRAHDLAAWATSHAHTGWLWVEAHKLPIDAGLGVTVAAAGYWWLAGRRGGKSTDGAKAKLTARLRPILKLDDGAEKFLKPWQNVDKTGGMIGASYRDHYPTDAEISRMAAIIGDHVGGKWDGARDTANERIVYVRQAPPYELPKKLAFADVTRSDDRGRVPLGVMESSEPLIWDQFLDPHMLVVGKSGSGKSNCLRMCVVHAARHGALIDILDPKRNGDFDQFAVLPNIRVWKRDADMIRAILEHRDEMDRRFDMDLPEDDPARLAWPQRMLVIDEMGEFVDMVRDDWNDNKPDGSRGQPPALRAYKSLLRKGRAADCRLVVGTQQGNAEAVGGKSEMRMLLSFKVALGEMDTSSANHIFTSAPPPVEKVPLRGVLEHGGKFFHIQTPWLGKSDAVRIATEGSARFTPEPEPVDLPEWMTTTMPIPMLPEPRARARIGVTLPTEPQPETTAAPKPTGTPMRCDRCDAEWVTRIQVGKPAKCPTKTCRKSQRVRIPVTTNHGE